MGVKMHDEMDDHHGSPKFVQKANEESDRRQARYNKHETTSKKAQANNGNGGRR